MTEIHDFGTEVGIRAKLRAVLIPAHIRLNPPTTYAQRELFIDSISMLLVGMCNPAHVAIAWQDSLNGFDADATEDIDLHIGRIFKALGASRKFQRAFENLYTDSAEREFALEMPIDEHGRVNVGQMLNELIWMKGTGFPFVTWIVLSGIGIAFVGAIMKQSWPAAAEPFIDTATACFLVGWSTFIIFSAFWRLFVEVSNILLMAITAILQGGEIIARALPTLWRNRSKHAEDTPANS